MSFTGGSHGHLRGPILAVDMDRPKTIEEEINGEKKNLEKMRSMNLPDMVAYCVDQMEVIDVVSALFVQDPPYQQCSIPICFLLLTMDSCSGE